jgi:ATP/maltotriose-dependent transcriptional regulator MalT
MWSEAERELADASRYLSQSRPPWEAEARVRLGELRRRQGRLAEAEQYFREVEWHPLASLGFAELSLAAGQVQDAEEYVQRVLRAVPERSVAQRAAALEVLARILAAGGRPEAAKRAVAEFEGIAGVIGTLSLQAELEWLSGVVAVASGDDVAARSHLEDAISLFERCRAPYEAAVARLALAQVLRGQERLERSRKEAAAALRVLEALGAEVDAATARALLDSGDAPGSQQHVVLTERQLEILRLVARGLGDREIASTLVMSEHTVHRHIANILQRLDLPSRSAAVAQASKLGLL